MAQIVVGRTVPMPTELVDALKEHRKTMMANQHPGLADNWVFCTDKGRSRLPQSLNKAFSPRREAAKNEQRVSPQVLLRTMNRMLLRAGVDHIVLSSMMGHCSEEMT
jgi:site-specific recombinase XerD